MKLFWLGVLMVLSGACRQVPPAPARPNAVDAGSLARTSASSAPPVPAEALVAEAAEDDAAAPGGVEPENSTGADWPRAWWLDSDACPEPLLVSGRVGLGPYDAFIDKALGSPAGANQLAVMRIGPSFAPSRAISVMRRADDTYWLRSTRLTTDVWAEMMKEMHALQGDSMTLDDRSQSEALSRITTSKVVHERKLPQGTAKLLVEVWRALTKRAQVVEPIGIATSKLDGTVYQLWYRGTGASTHSPARSTVLGDVVVATEHLERVVSGGSTDEGAELKAARDLLQSSLDRTRRNEPCLRRHTPQVEP